MPLDGGARWQIDILAADKTAQAFASVEKRLKSMEVAQGAMGQAVVGHFMNMAKGAATFTTALIAVDKVMSAGLEIGGIADQATQLGVTANQLQAYRLAASLAGVESANLDKALLTLTSQMYQAGQGDEAAIARFEKLNVKLLDSQGNMRSLGGVLPEVARGLVNMGNETERNGLAQEMLSRSGARTITMLGSLAGGNEEVIQKTRDLNALASGETIRAWNDLDAQLKTVEAQFKTLVATFALPIASSELRKLQMALGAIAWSVTSIKDGWAWITNGIPAGSPFGDLEKRANTIMETIKAMESGASGELDDIARARLKGLWSEWEKLQQNIADQRTAAFMPTITVTGDKGIRQPPPGRGGATKQLRDNVDEVGALIDRLEKQLESQATSLNDKFGDGISYAARATAELNQVLEKLDPGVAERALAEINTKAAELDRSFRGAQGGADAFMAGFEDGLASMAKANSEFEIGRRAVDALSESIDVLAGVSKKSFGDVAIEFALMVAKMEASKAASSALSGLGGGLWNGLVSMVGGLFSAAAGTGAGGSMDPTYGGNPFSFGGPRAAGGPVSGGSSYLVGENGPERFWPGQSGYITPTSAAGGGSPVIVHQTNHFGSDVSRAEMARWASVVEQRARDGAMSGVIDNRRRGGSMKTAFS